MKKLFLAMICLGILVTASGCAGFLFGAGTVGGVGAVGLDTIRLERYITPAEAWDCTSAVLDEMQVTITKQDKDAGTINAEIDNEEISIEILSVDPQLTAINVKVRKKGLPSLSFADSIVEKINSKISEMKRSAVTPAS